MTREEIRSGLSALATQFNPFSEESKLILGAVEALEQEPCEDAISREAVLDLCDSKDPDYKVIHFKEDVECLPPVNPQEPKYCDRNICIKNEYNGIGCDECEVTKSQEPKTDTWSIKDVADAFEKHGLIKEQEPCEDAISQEFLELVVQYPPKDLCTYPEYRDKPYYSIKYYENGECHVGYGTYNPEVLSRFLKDYFITPVKSQEPKTGHWIEHEIEDTIRWVTCSKCNCETHKKFNYCPNCGAYMYMAESEVETDLLSVNDVSLADYVKENYIDKKSKKCKDCKWWKDSDGVYRRGVGAESKCPINNVSVNHGLGYCYMFEPKGSEDNR